MPPLLRITPIVICLIVFVAGLWQWRRHNLFFRLMFFQVGLALVTEILGLAILLKYVTLGRGSQNIPVYNIYLFCEIWLAALAVGSLFNSRRFYRGVFACLCSISLLWVFSIWQNGWYYMVIWFYLAGSILVTALLLYVIKRNLETYFLSPRLTAYLLIIFGQLLFFGTAFETIALRYLIVELGSNFSMKTNYVLWTAAQARMVFFLIAFLLLRKKVFNQPSAALP